MWKATNCDDFLALTCFCWFDKYAETLIKTADKHWVSHLNLNSFQIRFQQLYMTVKNFQWLFYCTQKCLLPKKNAPTSAKYFLFISFISNQHCKHLFVRWMRTGKRPFYPIRFCVMPTNANYCVEFFPSQRLLISGSIP